MITRIPLLKRTAVLQKAYAEIEQYIMTKRTPTPQEKPGQVITKMNRSHPKWEKKDNIKVLIMKVS